MLDIYGGLKYEPIEELMQTKYRRLNTYNGRYYINESVTGNEFAPSVTTVLDAAGLGIPSQLKENLMIQHGTNYRRWLADKASYGTALHRLTETIIQHDTNITTSIAERVLSEEFKRTAKSSEIEDVMKDLAAIVKFLNDVNAKVYATEFMLFGKIAGKNICGTVDILAEIDVEYTYLDHKNPFKSGERKGEPRPAKGIKRELFLLDLKSGKWGFSDGHFYQLLMYRELFTKQYGNQFANSQIANIAPAEWRTEPAYKFKQHEFNFVDVQAVESIVTAFYLTKYEEPKTKKTILSIDRNGFMEIFEGYDYETE